MQSLFSTARVAERLLHWVDTSRLSDLLFIANTALSLSIGLTLAPFLGTVHTLVCTGVVWLNGLVILFAIMAWNEHHGRR